MTEGSSIAGDVLSTYHITRLGRGEAFAGMPVTLFYDGSAVCPPRALIFGVESWRHAPGVALRRGRASARRVSSVWRKLPFRGLAFADERCGGGGHAQ